MRALALCLLFTLVAVISSCADKGIDPSPKQQKKLDEHVDRLFEGIETRDATHFAADRLLLRDLHRIAFWIERYYEKAGHYPLPILADEEVTWHQAFVAGDESKTDFERPVNFRRETLLADLRDVLGETVAFPETTPGREYYSINYGNMRGSYILSAMLFHYVRGGEVITQDMCQYRVGSYESTVTPMLEFSGILDGAYKVLPEPAWRDPNMRPAR